VNRRGAIGAHPVLVVGVDGTEAALVAVGWAAREAARRDAVLRLVAVTPWRADPIAGANAVTRTVREAGRSAARAHLAIAAERVADHLPVERIERQVREGVPAEELGWASEEADLLVVGGPMGGWAGSLLGVALAGLSRCPLVVVERPGHPGPGAPVVVGIDGAEDADAALSIALAEALDRGVPLEVVHAWSDAPLDGGDVDFAAFAPEVRRVLDARIGRARRAFPEVEVRHTVVRDHPERALAQASRGAQLVVVGARGHAAAIPLGEVARQVVLAADCPVAIVGAHCRAAVPAPS